MKLKIFLFALLFVAVISFGFTTTVNATVTSGNQSLIQSISQQLQQLQQILSQMVGYSTASVYNSNLTCTNNSSCGQSGYTGSPTCQNGNVYQDYTTYYCNVGWAVPGQTASGTCGQSTSSQLKQTCSSRETCSNGQCSGQSNLTANTPTSNTATVSTTIPTTTTTSTPSTAPTQQQLDQISQQLNQISQQAAQLTNSSTSASPTTANSPSAATTLTTTTPATSATTPTTAPSATSNSNLNSSTSSSSSAAQTSASNPGPMNDCVSKCQADCAAKYSTNFDTCNQNCTTTCQASTNYCPPVTQGPPPTCTLSGDTVSGSYTTMGTDSKGCPSSVQQSFNLQDSCVSELMANGATEVYGSIITIYNCGGSSGFHDGNTYSVPGSSPEIVPYVAPGVSVNAYRSLEGCTNSSGGLTFTPIPIPASSTAKNSTPATITPTTPITTTTTNPSSTSNTTSNPTPSTTSSSKTPPTAKTTLVSSPAIQQNLAQQADLLAQVAQQIQSNPTALTQPQINQYQQLLTNMKTSLSAIPR